MMSVQMSVSVFLLALSFVISSFDTDIRLSKFVTPGGG